MPLPNLQQQNQALNDSLYETKKAAHAAGQDMEQLSKSVFSYGKALLAYGSFTALKESLKWGFEQLRTQRSAIQAAKEAQQLHAKRLTSLTNELEAMKKAGTFADTEIRDQELLVAWAEKKAEFLASEVNFREQILSLVKSQGPLASLQVFYLGLMRDAWKQTLSTAHEYNKALITANSNADQRFRLLYRTLDIQQQLGASTDDMADAAKNLVEYGGHLGANYQSNLKLITQMKLGLGVAANSAAEMAIVFTRQLQVGAEKVGDAIAQIAANTGLAAQKATSFAVEIGRALRLLGPSMRTEAAQVTKLIGTMAGRVEALGGSAESVVSVFKSLTSGSERGIMLRQMVGAPLKSMGTQQGVVDAMKGLDRLMQMRVTATEGTDQYAVQLEQLSEQVGVSAYDLINLRQVMQDWSKDTNMARTAQQAYAEQTRLAGESWKQIKSSLGAMIHEALLPFLQVLQPVVGTLADVIKAAANFKPLVMTLSVAMPLAAIAAVASLSRLIRKIWEMAATSAWVQGLLDKGGLVGKGNLLEKFPGVPSWAGAGRMAGTFWGQALGAGGKLSGMSMLTGGAGIGVAAASVAAVAAAGAAGVGVGLLVNKLMAKFDWWNNMWSGIHSGIMKVGSILHLWKAEQKSDKDAEKAWLKANTGGSPLDAARKAAQALVSERLRGGDPTATKVAMAAAAEKYAALGWTEAKTRSAITGMAFTEARAEVMRGAFARMTWNEAQDKAESKRMATELKRLQYEESMLKLQDQTIRMDAIRTDAAKAQLQSISEGSNRVHWQTVPPLDLNTNAGAYGPK